MARVSCHYCGLPFQVKRVVPDRDYFCCTGCAITSRLPIDEKGQFPVNAHLVSALVAGFLFFNELLFWLVAVLLVRESRMMLAERFFWLAGGAALAVWIALAVLQWREKAARVADFAVMALGLIVLLVTFRRLPPWPLPMAITNFGLIVWSVRGLLRKRVVG
jgi:hypothetical protein